MQAASSVLSSPAIHAARLMSRCCKSLPRVHQACLPHFSCLCEVPLKNWGLSHISESLAGTQVWVVLGSTCTFSSSVVRSFRNASFHCTPLTTSLQPVGEMDACSGPRPFRGDAQQSKGTCDHTGSCLRPSSAGAMASRGRWRRFPGKPCSVPRSPVSPVLRPCGRASPALPDSLLTYGDFFP